MNIRDRVEKERELRDEELGTCINEICLLLEYYNVSERELVEVLEPIKDSYNILDGEEEEVLDDDDNDDDELEED